MRTFMETHGRDIELQSTLEEVSVDAGAEILARIKCTAAMIIFLLKLRVWVEIVMKQRYILLMLRRFDKSKIQYSKKPTPYKFE